MINLNISALSIITITIDLDDVWVLIMYYINCKVINDWGKELLENRKKNQTDSYAKFSLFKYLVKGRLDN